MPSPTIFSYSLRGEYIQDKATVDIYVAYDAATETVSALLGAAAAYGGLIDAVSGGVITEFNVKINALPDPSWKTVADADVNLAKTLLMNFGIVDSKYPEPIEVPGVKGTLILPNGQPNLAAGGAIKALTDAITAGSGGVFPNSQFLIDLTGLRDASVTFRKRKGARRATKVAP